MRVFGTNYLKLRNQYLIPFIPHGIQRRNYEYWIFKDVITDKLLSLNKISANSFEIEIKEDDFYKGLYCEVQLFFSKSMIQYIDFSQSKLNSASWSFVTLYYLSFFASTTLFRFLHKGFIFLDFSHTKKFENYSLAMYSQPLKLNSGNYYFSVSGINSFGNILLTLTFKGRNIHQSHWIQMEQFLRDSIPDCDNDEKIIFSLLLKLFTEFPTEFQSTLRNKLNYKCESAIWDFEKKFPNINFLHLNGNFVKELLRQEFSKSDINQLNGTAIISVFLMKYILKLFTELTERSEYGKDFSKERNRYLKLKSYQKLEFDL